MLEYPPELESFLDALQIYPKNLAAARIDVFLTRDGFRMVESNTEIPGGNEESYFLENEYLRIYQPPGLEAVPRMEIVYETLMSYYRIQAKVFDLPPKDELVIYLCQWQPEIERIRGEYDVLMDFIRRQGHGCDVVDPNRIVIRDGKAFSPDGRQIVFYSNRENEDGRMQIWIMDADGSWPQNISNNPYNDWDPVWIKWPRDILK